MSHTVDDLWVLAMEQAAGREVGGGAAPADVPADVLALARRLVEVGRRVEALPPCPTASLRRAMGIPDDAPAPASVRLWALLFDSWTAAAPALRGGSATRFLRCGGEGGSIDVEVGETPHGGRLLRGTVDATGPDLALDVVMDGQKSLRVPVRAGGLFEATLPPPRHGFTLTLRSGRRVVARTPPLPPTA